MAHDERTLRNGAKILVMDCGRAKSRDSILVIADRTTAGVARYVLDAAKAVSKNVRYQVIEKASMHGHEPPKDVAHTMFTSDLIFCLTAFSMAHTKARKRATENGARYLSLPDYSLEQLASPALTVDYVSFSGIANRLKEILDKGKVARIRTSKGTDIELNIEGREANFCPGYCSEPGMLGSPPDIETNIAPNEEKSHGTLVVDGSIPCMEIGLLKDTIHIDIRRGKIHKIDTSAEQGLALDKYLRAGNNEKKLVLAEFGIGLNPRAKLCGRMLEDEGCMGTIHLGFGSNVTIGGKNDVNFHLDMVIRSPTILVDGIPIMKEGKLCETS